ncbi:hypothetical protein DL96DRAFT_1809475 [Flagelloscypha sp. PMI_526]|nr:hypothetical protein DL96DRAFT_1809475 [Flagelloscypha sp. PMI_526]
MSSPTTSGGSWSPRTPLSVTRLAKIANSFGYNLPSPSTENVRRSPSPNHFAAAAASSYVLEVIPPHDLPHDDNDVLTPPPSSATGYHPRYERGILVSVKPTLQSQLAAIAREYALPSTAGLVLYLVNEGSPGPRLSEDVWKVLWSRIMSSDNSYLPPPTPRTLNLLSPIPVAIFYIPHCPFRHPAMDPSDIPPSTPSVVSSTLRPLPTLAKSLTPLLLLLTPRPGPNSLESPGLPTSYELTLPGLSNPHALIPVLAKVEFDIDKSKATWFTPWIRSRHRNHAKRRAASESAREDQSETEQEGDSEKSRRPVIDLTIGTKDPMPFSHINGEILLQTSLVMIKTNGVFHHLNVTTKTWFPLALTPGDLDALDFEDEMAEEEDQEDIDEVREMINNATQPLRSPERNSTAALRRNVPPPLVLQPHSPSSSTQYSPGGTTVTTRLPYLRRTSEDEGEDSPEIDPSTSGSGSGKSDRRRLGIYDDIEFDFPEGDSKEQAQMKAELDAIERTLYQLSPRNQDEFDKQQLERDELAKSPSSSARTSKVHSPADAPDSGRTLSPPARIDEAPPTPEDDLEHEHSTDDDEPAWPATPFSVLKQKRMSGSSSRSSKSSASKRGSSSTSSGVPQLAVNCVGARRKSKTDDSPGSETTLRRKEAEEEDMAWRQSRASLKQRAPNSPIIPLSPDPFGRFSSATTNSSAGGSRASVYWEDDQPIVSAARKQTNPARPSTDSETSSAGGDSWRKDDKGAEGGQPHYSDECQGHQEPLEKEQQSILHILEEQ